MLYVSACSLIWKDISLHIAQSKKMRTCIFSNATLIKKHSLHSRFICFTTFYPFIHIYVVTVMKVSHL